MISIYSFLVSINELDKKGWADLKAKSEEFIVENNHGKYNYGIISAINDNNIIFIHKTYSEYFIASYLMKHIQEVEDILIEKILSSKDYEIIRLFINENEIETKKINYKADNIFDNNKYLNESLITAAEEGLKNIATFLIENKSKINYINEDGKICLIEASQNCHYEMIELLIQKGADLNIKKLNGNTPPPQPFKLPVST
jgi:hypothetical protein